MSVDKPRISDEFKSRLAELSEDETIRVIVGGVILPFAENLSQEEKGRLAVGYYNTAIETLVEYFKEHGIHVSYESIHAAGVCGALTRSQIYDLAKQPYVRVIEEEQALI